MAWWNHMEPAHSLFFIETSLISCFSGLINCCYISSPLLSYIRGHDNMVMMPEVELSCSCWVLIVKNVPRFWFWRSPWTCLAAWFPPIPCKITWKSNFLNVETPTFLPPTFSPGQILLEARPLRERFGLQIMGRNQQLAGPPENQWLAYEFPGFCC